MVVYQIKTEEDLDAIRHDTKGTYVLENDIYLTKWQTGDGWTPIPEFSGEFDGNGYTIHDLYINKSNTGVGFIEFLNAGEVKNVNFANVNIRGGGSTGVVASYAKGEAHTPTNIYQTYYTISQSAKITNVKVDGVIRSSNRNLGGLVGWTTTDINPSRWDDSQMINLDVTDSHVDLQMYAFSDNIGGIVGLASGGINIVRSSTRGNIHNGNLNVGGLIGSVPYYRGNITNSYSIMTIQGSNFVGGITGTFTTGHLNNQKIRTTYFAGTLIYPKDKGTLIGGAVGYGGFDEGIVLVDYEKLGFKNDRASIRESLDEINDRQNVVDYSTADMSKLETYYRHGYQIYGTWYDDLTSSVDSIQLRNEVPEHMITLEGSGTEENPFLIKNIYDLIALEDYDTKNWMEYFDKILNEYNNPNHINFKEDYKMPQPTRWHYKLEEDIDLDIFPFNTEGWIPLNRVSSSSIESQNQYHYYNSIGQIIGSINDAGVIDTVNKNGYRVQKGFIGILNGNGHKIKNLLLREIPNVTSSESTTYIGLFDTITGGTVKNLAFEDVKIDFDYYRESKPKESAIGVVSARIQGTAKIDRVTVKGESIIKDYRADVGGAKVQVSGLVHQGKRYDASENIDASTQKDRTGYIGSRKKSTISNCNVQLKHTYTNVLTGDDHNHFTPFMYDVAYVNIQDCYSATIITALDSKGKPLGGTHGDKVFLGKISTNKVMGYIPAYENQGLPYGKSYVISEEPNGVITRCYYDSEIVNAESSPVEVENKGWVEIYGRSTKAMKLQATYVGWDFARTWDTDSVNYPKYKPFDEHYEPPTNSVTQTVSTYLDAPYLWVDSNGIHRQLRKVTVKTKAKKFVGKTSKKRKSTANMNTQVQPLHSIAFKYDSPIFHNAIAETEVIEFNCSAQSFTKTKKANNLVTSIDELNTSVEAEGISKGIFFGSIEITSIGVNSILVKVNDKRVKQLEFMSGVYTVADGMSYTTLSIDPNSVLTGENIYQINALNNDGDILVSKGVKVEKEAIPFKNKTNRTLIVNGESYKIINHSSDGIMTLNKNLSENVSKILPNGQYNSVELVEFDSTPKIAIGKKGSDLEYVTGNLVNTKKIGNEVEEEYEFIGEGNIAKTEIEFTRELPATTATAGNDSSLNGISVYNGILSIPSGVAFETLNYYKNNGKKLETMVINGVFSENENSKNGKASYQLIEIDVEKFVKKNINDAYKHSPYKDISLTMNYYGFQRIKLYTHAYPGFIEKFDNIFVWNNYKQLWERTTPTTVSHAQSKNVTSLSISGRDYTFNGSKSNNALFGNKIYFLIQTDAINSLNLSPQSIDVTNILTDHIEVIIDAPDQNNEIPVLKNVKQVFIPKDQKTTI